MEIELSLIKSPAFTLPDLWELAHPRVDCYSFSQYFPCWAHLQLPLPRLWSPTFSLQEGSEKVSSVQLHISKTSPEF